MPNSLTTLSYQEASDAEVLAAYEAGCAAEVRAYDAGMDVPAVVATTTDAWMSEAMRRGLI
jgi:hypothetical protein